MPEAAEILNELANCKTPIEMLDVFQKAIDSFSQRDIQQKTLTESSNFGTDSSDDEDTSLSDSLMKSNDGTLPPLASSPTPTLVSSSASTSTASTTTTILAGDDVLPALVSALIYQSSPTMHTTCFYIDNFLFFDLSATSLGYVHATLKAAIEYINHTYESLPDEKKVVGGDGDGDEGFFASTVQPDDQMPRKSSAKHPPPLMNAPIGTVKAAPLPGATTRMYDKAPNPELGMDPRSNKILISFLKTHKKLYN